ncbi:MAG TPA: DUF4296 domain-containing protein [Bacteroidales bacterium]
MKNYLTLAIILVLVISCGQRKTAVPASIIPEERMVTILTDYHLAQSLNTNYRVRNEMLKNMPVRLSDSVLKANGVTKAQLDSSLTYYATDLERFEKIYDEVLNRLNKMQAKLQDTPKKDSSKVTKK